VALADLVKDPRLISTSRDVEVRRLTADFVLRRVRRLVELNPADADPRRPGDITAAATTTLATLIAGELPKVHAAAEEMWRRVAADAQQLPIDPATQRKRGTKRVPTTLRSALGQRRRLVRSIAYQAAAVDITLTDPGGLDRLHRICDRRLRIVERMVYDVGRPGPRSWNLAQIESHRGGPWPDGYERLFEYPRVPASLFLRTCRRGPMGLCSAPMQEWAYPVGDPYLHAAYRPNPSSRAVWRMNDYGLDFVPGAGDGPVAAIQKLFQPSPDFLGRNLMMCDHTIHALHLEALVFAMTKRGRGTAWLDADVAANGAGWLRLDAQFDTARRFLAGPSEPLFFEHVTVRRADLQVGDHLIVYNHPAYAATTAGVWSLENAIVVQTFPQLLMQGHGSAVHNQEGMWTAMIRYFRQELKEHRAAVEGLARIERFGPNTLAVNDAQFLKVGMPVDIVRDDAGEEVLAANREIVSVSGRTIRYSGASVSASARHRLRRARITLFDDRKEAIDGGTFQLARRVPSAQSQYEGIHQRADWFLIWMVRKQRDEAVRADPARAAFVKARHFVEFTREQDSGTAKTVGWFPLWRPSSKAASPMRRNGRIVNTEPVDVQVRDVAGWTWFFDPDPAKRDRVAVIRPREL
jgi:hypothetical protein